MFVEVVIRFAGGIGLPACLTYSPLATRSINGKGGPPAAVLIAEVYEQGVGVVLDAEAMLFVGLLVQTPHGLSGSGILGDERGPSSLAPVGPGELAVS